MASPGGTDGGLVRERKRAGEGVNSSTASTSALLDTAMETVSLFGSDCRGLEAMPAGVMTERRSMRLGGGAWETGAGGADGTGGAGADGMGADAGPLGPDLLATGTLVEVKLRRGTAVMGRSERAAVVVEVEAELAAFTRKLEAEDERLSNPGSTPGNRGGGAADVERERDEVDDVDVDATSC